MVLLQTTLKTLVENRFKMVEKIEKCEKIERKGKSTKKKMSKINKFFFRAQSALSPPPKTLLLPPL
jgi:hypothetical protein